MEQNRVISELNVLDVVKYIGRKNKRLQAILLQKFEEALGRDNKNYPEIRKFILDEVNNYTRAVVRQIFGDVEFLIPD